jgi:hypothetical protein
LSKKKKQRREMMKKRRRTTTTPSDPAAPHFLFGTWCQRGSELIYLCVWTMNLIFMYLNLELWLVITLNSYVCETMWAWDIWLCACDDLLYFFFLRMLYDRLKNYVKSVFSLKCWKPGEFGDFPGVSGFSGHSGVSPDSPDFSATDFFFYLVECIICHEHLTFICCTSQAPHWCNTLMFLFLCKFLALIGPLIFKIKMHILRGSIKKAFNIHCLSLVWPKCVVINHQKGGDWRVSWPPKWVLVI